jgi:hypothetical protein
VHDSYSLPPPVLEPPPYAPRPLASYDLNQTLTLQRVIDRVQSEGYHGLLYCFGKTPVQFPAHLAFPHL